MTHFNGMGLYLQRIESAKKRQPVIGAEYEAVLDEIMQNERIASDTWGIIPETEENYKAKQEYIKEVMLPLKIKHEILWQRLFGKVEPEINERQEVRSNLY
jgi:hypothetical protein